jgi:indolepyruvate ferredoxin oxidoreductase
LDQLYELRDRYERQHGTVYLTGTDALVRLCLEQAECDRRDGLNTAGFVSGYRGSPLGTLDLALGRAQAEIDAGGIRFEPGLNEDLAATALWGTQQSSLMDNPTVDGVFGLWYGKGPGVDRSTDALKHANYAGTSPRGGVVVVAGDDPGAKSSSLAHQSEPVLAHCGIPVFSPSSPQEFLTFGLAAWAASRYSGSWTALRCPTDLMDSAATIDLDAVTRTWLTPLEPRNPDRHIKWARSALEQERLVVEERVPAVQAFVRANHLDGLAFGAATGRLGIVTSGKTYLDVLDALDQLGIDQEASEAMGLGVYKVALSWPLEPAGITALGRSFQQLLVVEEKRALIEDQIAALLYGQSWAPSLEGKSTRDHSPLLPATGEMTTAILVPKLAEWLGLPQPADQTRPVVQLILHGLERKPAFCAGCPHNASTVVPNDAFALGGIGCHGMATYMPERNTLSLTQMGGEGANWIGISPFTETTHLYQNMGDGTYFHSGLLAIRAAVYAKVNITYKLLANGAVAMTGGQAIEGHSIEATVLVRDVVTQLLAEGVREVVVVTDKPGAYRRGDLPGTVRVVDRSHLAPTQERLASIEGVTVLVYDQTCAAEARRLRKRSQFPDPDKRVIINEFVCEGCGDCNAQSNCIAIEPLETEFGRKREINQHSCNKDFSCLKGYCPSFAIVSGGTLRRRERVSPPPELIDVLPEASVALSASIYNIMVGGIGGTGVATVGSIIAMAAHLEGKSVTQLDITGLAQKNGSVSSHIRICEQSRTRAPRISTRVLDLLIGADLVVATEQRSLDTLSRTRSTALVNLDVVPTADFALNPTLNLDADPMLRQLERYLSSEQVVPVHARHLARELLGDEVGTNMLLVGLAAQRGLLPVGIEAIERAIALNGASVELNLAALTWGRIAAHDLAAAMATAQRTPVPQSADGAGPLQARVDFLTQYQDASYANRYEGFVSRVAEAERAVTDSSELSNAVTRNLFKLMAYKDEYEVARLYTDGSFRRQVSAVFDGDYSVSLNLAPQRFFPHDPSTGRPRKITFGPLIFVALRLLRRFTFARGHWYDPFGRTAHRKRERALISEYQSDISREIDRLTTESYADVVRLASLPQEIKGFGDVKDASIAHAAVLRTRIKKDLTGAGPATQVDNMPSMTET